MCSPQGHSHSWKVSLASDALVRIRAICSWKEQAASKGSLVTQPGTALQGVCGFSKQGFVFQPPSPRCETLLMWFVQLNLLVLLRQRCQTDPPAPCSSLKLAVQGSCSSLILQPHRRLQSFTEPLSAEQQPCSVPLQPGTGTALVSTAEVQGSAAQGRSECSSGCNSKYRSVRANGWAGQQRSARGSPGAPLPSQREEKGQRG